MQGLGRAEEGVSGEFQDSGGRAAGRPMGSPGPGGGQPPTGILNIPVMFLHSKKVVPPHPLAVLFLQGLHLLLHIFGLPAEQMDSTQFYGPVVRELPK